VRRCVTLSTVLCAMFVGLVTFPGSVSASSPPEAAMPRITWGACSDPALTAVHAQCGWLNVPLDYKHRNGSTVRLALARVQHTSPASQYQGVMLTNPGGPGAPGVQLATLGQFVPNHVGDRYDWIGFDPRGVGSSTPALSCVPDYFAGDRPPFAPSSSARLRKWLARSKAYAAACEANAPQLLAHMKTTDSARDMDSIRIALGADRISYYGFSYGTYLGEVYATLFPTHVLRMVFDSSVDPTHVWYKTNLTQAVSIERNIKFWFGWLAKYDGVYHLGATERAVERLFYRQVAALRKQPAQGVLGPDEWEDAFYAAAYTQSVWTLFGSFFSSWIHQHNAGGVIAAYQAFDTPGNDNTFAVSNAVSCTDAPWPQKWSTWSKDYWRTRRTARFATWNIAWYSAPCLYWSAPAATPVRVNGRRVPALLVDETLDGVTPFEGSLTVRTLFPKSSLLAEPGGTTHAGTLLGNACVDGHIAAFLATGALPSRKPGHRADATCKPSPQPTPTGAQVMQAASKATLAPLSSRLVQR
jgi:pimeloyl-ACP methyl ester carboxylesterase